MEKNQIGGRNRLNNNRITQISLCGRLQSGIFMPERIHAIVSAEENKEP